MGKWEEIVHEVHFACFDEPEIQKQPYRQDANSVFASVFVTIELVVILPENDGNFFRYIIVRGVTKFLTK